MYYNSCKIVKSSTIDLPLYKKSEQEIKKNLKINCYEKCC